MLVAFAVLFLSDAAVFKAVVPIVTTTESKTTSTVTRKCRFIARLFCIVNPVGDIHKPVGSVHVTPQRRAKLPQGLPKVVAAVPSRDLHANSEQARDLLLLQQVFLAAIRLNSAVSH